MAVSAKQSAMIREAKKKPGRTGMWRSWKTSACVLFRQFDLLLIGIGDAGADRLARAKRIRRAVPGLVPVACLRDWTRRRTASIRRSGSLNHIDFVIDGRSHGTRSDIPRRGPRLL